MKDKNNWGIITKNNEELWEDFPVFSRGKTIGWIKLFLKIKKFITIKYLKINDDDVVLDFGCGTGAQCIDMKKIGKKATVFGATISKDEISQAKRNNDKYNVDCEYTHLASVSLPFENESFTKIFSSDVLGHVKNYEFSLSELSRILKKGGAVAIFTETSRGRHLWPDKYLGKLNINIDPHKEFHISLHDLSDIKKFFDKAGLEIEKIYSPFFLRFFTFPHWYHPYIHKNKKVHPLLRVINLILFNIRKYTRPLYDIIALVYNYIELLTIGKLLETQGAIILAKKRS